MNKVGIVVLVCVVLVLALPFLIAPFRGGETAAPAPSPAPAPSQVLESPRVVSMSPENNARAVSPRTTALVVTFDVPMGAGFSWTGGGETFPEGTGKPYWSSDSKTCTLPVRLKPNWNYRLGLNSPSHRNFRSASGKELTPMVWTFTTGP